MSVSGPKWADEVYLKSKESWPEPKTTILQITSTAQSKRLTQKVFLLMLMLQPMKPYSKIIVTFQNKLFQPVRFS